MSKERMQKAGAHSESNRGVLRELFAIDVRSLAVLRVGTALMVLIDLARRSVWIELFYSNGGVLTSAQAREFLGAGYWSIYWLDGSPFFAQVLFVLTAISAIGLLVGFKTRWMNLICLVLVWSLQMRNPMLLTAGHVLLRMMLFWMLFLPVATIWSVDAVRKKPQPLNRPVLSLGSAAIMLQVAYVYFFSGLAKWNTYWLSGSAMEYAMNLEMYVKPTGEWLTQYPEGLQLITTLTLALEIIGPVLMFIPRCSSFFRGCLMGFFWLLHLGIWITMSIGIFSAVAMLAWVVFLPSEVWNSMLSRQLPDEQTANEGGSCHRRWIPNLIAGFFLVYITLQNVFFTFSPEGNLKESRPWIESAAARLEWIGRVTMTVQQFRMFDTPPLYDPWYEYGAVLKDGRQADLFSGQIFSGRGIAGNLAESSRSMGQRPTSVYDWMQNQYWRRLHWNATTHPDTPPKEIAVYEAIRRQMLFRMVAIWDAKHPNNPVQAATFKCYLPPIRLSREEPLLPTSEPSPMVWATYVRGDQEN